MSQDNVLRRLKQAVGAYDIKTTMKYEGTPPLYQTAKSVQYLSYLTPAGKNMRMIVEIEVIRDLKDAREAYVESGEVIFRVQTPENDGDELFAFLVSGNDVHRYDVKAGVDMRFMTNNGNLDVTISFLLLAKLFMDRYVSIFERDNPGGSGGDDPQPPLPPVKQFQEMLDENVRMVLGWDFWNPNAIPNSGGDTRTHSVAEMIIIHV